MNSLTPHFKFPAPKLNNFSSTIPNSSTPFILSAIAAVQTPSSKISTKPTKNNPLTPIESPTSSATPASTLPKKVLIPIGFGTEEMEAVILINVLRRAGAKVTVASVEHHLEVEASSGTKLIADTLISTCSNETFDLIALPGGMPGSVRLRDSTILKSITCKHVEEKRLYGAICAAPAITLLPWGLLKRKPSTCHPAFIDKISPFLAVKSNIQVSGELTTSRGPGTSFQFAISLVEQLFCESVAKEIGESLLMNGADVNSRSKEFNEIKWSFDHLPQVLIPIANGSEEIEFVTIVDILRRAKVNVLIASVERSVQIVASRGTKIKADKSIKEASESIYDLIILPGGSNGTERLNKSRILKKMLKEQELAGRLLGAICSSPEILQRQGLLKDKKVTAHPIVVNKLKNVVDDANVVIDSNLITSTGLSTATDFALAIVRKFFGHARARSVAEGLVVDYPRS